MPQAGLIEGEVARLITLAEKASDIPNSEASWYRGVRFSFDRARLNDPTLPKEVGDYLSSSPDSPSRVAKHPQLSLETSKAGPGFRMGIGSYFDSGSRTYLPWGISVTSAGVEVIPAMTDVLKRYLANGGIEALAAGFLHLAEELITSPYHPPKAICIPPEL